MRLPTLRRQRPLGKPLERPISERHGKRRPDDGAVQWTRAVVGRAGGRLAARHPGPASAGRQHTASELRTAKASASAGGSRQGEGPRQRRHGRFVPPRVVHPFALVRAGLRGIHAEPCTTLQKQVVHVSPLVRAPFRGDVPLVPLDLKLYIGSSLRGYMLRPWP